MTNNKEAVRQLSMDAESCALHGHQNEIKQTHVDNMLLARNTPFEKIPSYQQSGTTLETCGSAKTIAGHQSGITEIKTDKTASYPSGTSSKTTERPRVRLLSDQEVKNYRYLDDFFHIFTDKTQTQLNDKALFAAFQNENIVGVGFGLNDKKFPCFTLMVQDDVFKNKGSHEAILDDVASKISEAQSFAIASKRCKQFLKIQPMVALPNAKTLKHGGSRLLNNKRQPIGTITCVVKAEVEIIKAEGKKCYPRHFAITCAHCILPLNPRDPLFKLICAEEEKGDKPPQPGLQDVPPIKLMDTPPHDAELVMSPPSYTSVEHYGAKKPFAPDCLRYGNHPWKQHELMKKSKYFIRLPDSSEQELKYCCSRFGICTEHPDLPCMDLLQEDYFDVPNEVFYTVDIGVLRFVNRFTFCCCGIKMRSLPSQKVTNKAQFTICNPFLPQDKPNELQSDEIPITAAIDINKEYIGLRIKTYSLVKDCCFMHIFFTLIVVMAKQHAAKRINSGKNLEDIYIEEVFQHQPEVVRDFFANCVKLFEKDVIRAQSDAKNVLILLNEYGDKGPDGKKRVDKMINKIISENIILQSYFTKGKENFLSLRYKLMKKILLTQDKEKSKHSILIESISQLENQISNIKEKEIKFITMLEKQLSSVTSQPQEMSVQNKAPLQQAQCNTPKRMPEEVYYFIPTKSTAEPLSTKKQKPIRMEKMIDIWTQMCQDEATTLKIGFLKTSANRDHINNDQDQAIEPVFEQNDLRGLQFYLQVAVRTKQQKFLKLPVIMFPSKDNEQGEDEEFIKDGDSGSPLFLISENDADTQCYFLGNVCGSTAATRWDIGITSIAPKILETVLLDIDDENTIVANTAWLRLKEKFFRKDSTYESEKTVWAEEKIVYETERGTVTSADVKFTITPCLETCCDR